MKIYDISMMIQPNMPVYKSRAEKRPIFLVNQDFDRGGKTHESSLSLDLHTGTHLDAPLHMFKGGPTAETVDLRRLFVPCRVLDFTEVRNKIRQEDFAGREIRAGDFLLCQTRNSWADEFDPEFVYVDKGGAQYLREMKVNGVGIDALGIEREQPEHETHKILLEGGIIILEGLRLKAVEPGEYILSAFPLKIQDVEAAPVRAVLLQGLDSSSPTPLR